MSSGVMIRVPVQPKSNTNPTTSTTTNTNNENNMNNSQQQQQQHPKEEGKTVIKQQKWKCDVCKEATFPTLEEATAHEEQCAAAAAAAAAVVARKPTAVADKSATTVTPPPTTTTTTTTAADAKKKPLKSKTSTTLHPFFQVKPKSAKAAVASNNSQQNNNNSTATRKRKNTAATTKDEETKTRRKSSRAASASSATTTTTTTSKVEVVDLLSPIAKKQVSDNKTKPKNKSNKRKQQQEDDTTRTTTAKRKSKTAPSGTAAATATTASSSSAAEDWSHLIMLSEQDRQALLAQQRAAEFHAKRRRQAEQERERQRKRQARLLDAAGKNGTATAKVVVVKDHDDDGPQETTTAAAVAAFTSFGKTNTPAAHSTTLSPRVTLQERFPRPNHVLGNENDRTNVESSIDHQDRFWFSKSQLDQMRQVHKQQQRLALEQRSMTVTADDDDDDNDNPVPLSNHAIINKPPTRQDLLFHIWQACLTIPTNTNNFSLLRTCNPTCLEDWVGTSVQNAITQVLIPWIQEWKCVRQRSLEHMQEKQRKLAGQKQKKKKTTSKRKTTTTTTSRYADDEDWIWDGDDDYDSDAEHDLGLPSLCLLSGPSGCGKTALVHWLAQHCDCSLLEINTSQKRGAAALKKAIGEATQSLSSKDLLSKQQQQKKKNGIASFWGTSTTTTAAAGAQKKKESENADSESEADENNEKKDKEGSSLTAILIDEVDNLYQDNGDSGFWSALSELSKRAKCPIFLTANSFPEPLLASAFGNLKHLELTAPTPAECIRRLRQWIDEQPGGFIYRQEDSTVTDRLLEKACILCQCDLRKLAYELQSYAYHTPAKQDDTTSLTTKTTTSVKDFLGFFDISEGQSSKANTGDSSKPPRPLVQRVAPRAVHATDYDLITVTGSHFLPLAHGVSGFGQGGYPVHVCVGDQLCPLARIMDDTTILAVCPPVPISARKSHRSAMRSVSLSYAPIRVCSFRKTGLLSDSEGVFEEQSSEDLVSLASLATPVYLERHFPGSMEYYLSPKAASKPLEEEKADCYSDEEFEFADEIPSQTSDPISNQDHKTAAGLLKEGIDAWCSRNRNVAQPIQYTRDSSCNVEELEQVCKQREFTSDAALLEDIGMLGLPYLSGASRGFGFDLTDVFPSCTNEKNKRPSEDSLFKHGWKDDCGFFGNCDMYTTLPLNRRERNLLARNETSARGLSFPKTAGVSEEEDDKKEESTQSDVCDEDMFLPNDPSAPLWSLPAYLRTHGGGVADPFIKLNIDERLAFESTDRRNQMRHWLIDYIFVCGTRKHSRFFADLYRTLDPLLSTSDAMDSRLWLDYLPLLRCMALLDQAGEISYQKALSLDPESASALSKRRRQTRRSKQQGYKYYVESLVPSQVWHGDDEVSAKDLASAMAEFALRSGPSSQEMHLGC